MLSRTARALAAAVALATALLALRPPLRSGLDLPSEVRAQGIDAGAPWPAFQHDGQHTGRSTLVAPSQPAVRWRLVAWSGLASSPMVGRDGVVYLAGDGGLYALNPDGSQRWRASTGSVGGSALVSDSGVVYVTGTSQLGSIVALYAINADGSIRWRIDAPGSFPLGFTPGLAASGTVYFAVGNQSGIGGSLYAVNPDGSLKWRLDSGFFEGSAPALAGDGTIYIGTMDSVGQLLAVWPDGTLKWQYPVQWRINSSPSIGADGTVYVGSWDGNLYALRPDGTLRWRYPVGRVVFSSPALGADGSVYIGGEDSLYAIGVDGTLRWRVSCLPGGFVDASPAIAADGLVLFQTSSSSPALGVVLCAADSATGAIRWRFTTQSAGGSGPLVPSATLADNGLAYVPSPDGALYALADASAPPPPTPSAVNPAGVIVASNGLIGPNGGGVNAGSLNLGVPIGAVARDSVVAVRPRATPSPSVAQRTFAAFSVTADGGASAQLDADAALTVRLDPAALQDVDTSTVTIYYVSGTTRQPLSCLFNPTDHSVRCLTRHFSDFEVAGAVLPTPTPRSAPTPCACRRLYLPLIGPSSGR